MPGRRARSSRRRWRVLALFGMCALLASTAACAARDGGASGEGGSSSRSSEGSDHPQVSGSQTPARIDVGGRQIALSCTGSGPKTVVLVGDIGQDGRQAWGKSKVPELLSAQARVCSYDRLGLGTSDPADTPRSVANQAKELSSLITAAGFPPPVYVAAQGYGTLVARQLTKDDPTQVAGLVLIDPPLWGLDLRVPEAASAGVKAEYDYLPQLNSDLALYGAGALPPGPIPVIVLGIDGTKPPLPEAMPLTEVPFPPTTTVFPLPPIEKRHEDQKALAQKSPFGKFEVVDGSGSYVQYSRPEAAADAIIRVISGGVR